LSSRLQVTGFQPGDALVSRFVELRPRLWSDAPWWVPQPEEAATWRLSGANPMFGYAAARGFVCEAAGRLVARCVAVANPRLTFDEEPVGAVGLFEWDRSAGKDAAIAVLDAAADWLAGQGLTRLVGPISLSIWHGYRFMTRGFEADPFYGEPRNPPWYPELFERWGFRPRWRWESWDLPRAHVQKMLDAADRIPTDRLPSLGLRVVPWDPADFDAYLAHLHAVLCEGFVDNVGYSAIDADEFIAIHRPMKAVFVPDLSPLLLDASDRAVGFCTIYPDVAAVLQGRSPAPQRLVQFLVVLLPGARGHGAVNAAFVSHTFRWGLENGFDGAIGALVRTGPSIYQKCGPATREYALYERRL